MATVFVSVILANFLIHEKYQVYSTKSFCNHLRFRICDLYKIYNIKQQFITFPL